MQSPSPTETHETLSRTPPYGLPPDVSGIRMRVHLRPFQRSASGPPALVLVETPPTAIHAVREAHETARRYPPFGLGVRWIFHLLPFHRSTSAPGSPKRVLEDAPTAVQALAEEQDTARNPLWGVGLGLR